MTRREQTERNQKIAALEKKYVEDCGQHLFGTMMSSPAIPLHDDLAAIVVDEACQGTEPETITPLCRAGELTRTILIGDPAQLPPTCESQGAADEGLICSLM